MGGFKNNHNYHAIKAKSIKLILFFTLGVMLGQALNFGTKSCIHNIYVKRLKSIKDSKEMNKERMHKSMTFNSQLENKAEWSGLHTNWLQGGFVYIGFTKE